MLIVGAGGFAREVLEVLEDSGRTSGLAFYDDVNPSIAPTLYDRFPVLSTEAAVAKHFVTHGPDFTIGIGGPQLRMNMWRKFTNLGGRCTSVISPGAHIGSFDVNIGEGCNILYGAVFSNSAGAGIGCIVYYNTIVTHDCCLGDFVQLAPGVSVLGGASLDSFSFAGANATILPHVTVGRYAVVAAGSVVSRDVPAHALVIGNPARRTGWVSEYGKKLSFDTTGLAVCPSSGDQYQLEEESLRKITTAV